MNSHSFQPFIIQLRFHNLSTSESVARKMTEITVENVDTEEEMVYDDLTIPGDYIDYDILDEEKRNYIKK